MEQPDNRRSLLSRFFPAIAFLIILIAVIITSIRINTLEDQVSTSPITNRIKISSYGINVSKSQIIYVPVYSHLNSTDGTPHLLETTLSIRNSDPKNSINLLSARYYDTEGKKLDEYLSNPMTLKPLQSTEFLIEKNDTRGGSGANFIVEWASDIPVYEPVIEAIMVGGVNNGISFKSFGRPLSKRKNK